MSNDKETITIQIHESFTFGNYEADDFDKVLSFFDWSLKNKKINANYLDTLNISKKQLRFGAFLAKKEQMSVEVMLLHILYYEYLIKNNCLVNLGRKKWKSISGDFTDWGRTKRKANRQSKIAILTTIIDSSDRENALDFGQLVTENLDIEYKKTLRYVLNEILYNTLEHGRNGHDIPSLLQFILNEESNELSFIVADVGVGIKKHLKQAHPNLATDVEAILLSLKPQVSGTFGKETSNYQTRNNAGVGLYFSSNIAQRLNADMFIVSGNGFVHISPNEIISKELNHQWKGTFVYVKIKLGLIEDLNLQKMLSEITKSIPKTEKVTTDNNLYISVRNYFGRYAEDKDLAKKIRDNYLLPALAENKSLTIDFEDIISAPHSLLNAMLATPIEKLGLSAYKKIKIINAAPEIRETLDFIFDDNTANA